jgi:hypothetical protein
MSYGIGFPAGAGVQTQTLPQTTGTAMPLQGAPGMPGQHHPHPIARLAQMIDSGNIQGAQAMIQRIAQNHPEFLAKLEQHLQDPNTQARLAAHGHNPQDVQTIAQLIQSVTGGAAPAATPAAPTDPTQLAPQPTALPPVGGTGVT